MRLPVIHGRIRRRLLVNFRVDPEVMERFLPSPFRPKLHRGHAIAGICLIRLEEIRPCWLPRFLGLASENAAHRLAVVWDEPGGGSREGVYIPHRDTGSRLNHFAGGRVFPGEHHLSDFDVHDDGKEVDISVHARDAGMTVEVVGRETDAWPDSSCFESLGESSAFFEAGSVGYSATADCRRLDGIRLEVDGWRVRSLAVSEVHSSFFGDERVFPAGSVVFDHALLMRDIVHRWHSVADLFTTDAPMRRAIA